METSTVVPASAARMRIVLRDFICQFDKSHRTQFAIRTTHEVNLNSRTPMGAEFKPVSGPHSSRWWPIPLCQCGSLCTELELYNPGLVSVPQSERAMFWLSPDGQRLAVPGNNAASMPERYRRAGYLQVTAASFSDLDRFDSIRAAQTGNDVANEMNYDSATRTYRRETTPDFDDEGITKSEV
jgi:hypothetical protein